MSWTGRQCVDSPTAMWLSVCVSLNFLTSPYLVLECYQRQFADHSRIKVGRSIWKHKRISEIKALLSLKNATITIGKVWYDSGSIICETSSPLLVLVWVATTKLISKNALERFLSLLSIFGYLEKETKNTAEHVIMNKIFIYASPCVNKDFVHSGSIGLIRARTRAMLWHIII